MAERYVRMNILSSGEDKAKATLDDLTARARKLQAESPDLKITADDTKASATIKDLQLKIQILNRERAEIAFETKGDEKVKGTLLDISAKLRDLDLKVAKPSIKLQDIERTEASLIKIKLMMDAIHNKRVDIKINESGNNGFIKNSLESVIGKLFGRGGGKGGGGGISSELEGGGGGGSGLLSAIGGANNSYFGGLIASLIAIAGSIAPALIPFGIGGLAGIGGAAGGLALGSSASGKLVALEQSLTSAKKTLAGATGTTASGKATHSRDAAAVAALEKQIAAFKKSNAAPLGLYGAGTGLLSTAKNTFLGSLTSELMMPGVAGNRTGGTEGIAGTSFLSGLTGIIKQLGGFVKTLGPGLADMFRASIPFLSTFAKIFEQLAKLLLPAFTQSMKQLQPFLPQIMEAFGSLSQGIADFIKDLGPGMQNAVVIFKGLMLLMKGILIGLAFTFDGLAFVFRNIGHHAEQGAQATRHVWDEMRAWTSKTFDDIRHDIAHIWDDIAGDMVTFGHDFLAINDATGRGIKLAWDEVWAHTIGAFIQFTQDDERWMAQFRHWVANTFDGIRHDVATDWNRLWADTISTTVNKAKTVWHNFQNLSTNIVNTVKGLPAKFLNYGKEILDDLLSGAQSKAKGVLGWFENLGKSILGFFGKVFHFGSPSKTMAQYGGWIIEGLNKGMQDKMGSLASSVGGMGKNVAQWLMEALSITHKPMSWLPALEHLVSKESGGNPRAVDPIPVGSQHAEGLLQTLPSTFGEYGLGGSIFDPVANAVASIRYISSTYGSPLSIPGLYSGNYRGYALGGMINEPVVGRGLRSGATYGFGETGRPEYVSTEDGGGGGGDIYITVAGDSDPDAAAMRIWQKLRDMKRHKHLQSLGL